MKILNVSLLSILLISGSILKVSSYGEGDANGLPIWQERESLNMMNAVRIDPKGYMGYFMSSGYNNLGNVMNIYPATNPVYYNSVLNGQARYHSQDMGINGCFSHNDCSGGTISNRFARFNTGCQTGWGENLSAGLSDGVSTQNQLICETVPNCVNDGVNDGHRSNMMSSRWVAAGAGFYYQYSALYRYYWSQDYKDATCEPQTSPIYSGSHSFYKSNTPNFMAVYYNSKGETLQSAKIFFGSGGSGNLNVVVGSSNKGLYSYISSSYISCDTYIFEFITTNGNVYRYPDTGSLTIVTNTGSCDAWVSSYIAGSTSTSTPAPTTQPPASTTQPPASTTQPPAPTTQPPAPTTQPPVTSTPTSIPSSTTQPPVTSNSTSSSSSTINISSSTNSDSQNNSNENSNNNNNSNDNSNNNNSNSDQSTYPGGINQSSSDSSDSYQIIPNVIIPLLLGAFIKIILL